MNYEFKIGINEKEYDTFVRNFPSTSFMQTPSWAHVKTAWAHDFVGLYTKDKLVCGAMILKRKLFFGKKLFYIPRGIVAYYKDKKALKTFIVELKKYAKKDGAIDIKIDPTQSLEIISALSDHLLRQPASLDATFYHL